MMELSFPELKHLTLNHRVMAGEIMTKTLICASPRQDLVDLERLLFEQRISGVPVVDQGRLVGVVTRSDIGRVQVLMSALDGQVTDQMIWSEQADGFQHDGFSIGDARPAGTMRQDSAAFQGFRERLAKLKVKDAMVDQVVTCTKQTPVGEVARTMVRMHIHRVIVVEGDNPIGIISSLDLVKLLALYDAPDSN